ncbi:hypothetical protein BGX23_002794 [Mortierella sp. AD031]|nr:hypothetical protein BGX23_002794 [Mortierella sp. AD031]KAG0205847.1 hypothetical protein BGX33_007719 [Mortierella sp. NVP41]
MKFTLSAVVLALAASQAAAVVPIPVKECTMSYVVEPGTPGCDAFAAKFGVTFADLLKWNNKLRPDCANLDIGEAICVSITPGKCCMKENPHGIKVPLPGMPEQPKVWSPAPYTKGPASPTVTGAPVVPTGNSTATGAPVAPTGNSTATAAPTTGAPGKTSSLPVAVLPTGSPTPKNDATGSKASMVLAAAGVVLSVAYML